jgi:hypothetical protein
LTKTPTLIAIGLWHSHLEPDQPKPTDFVDEEWDKAEKQVVINRLKSGYALPYPYAGKSWCRFNCGETEMGNHDMSDGIFLWPEGLLHYILHHAVRLPANVVEQMTTKPLVYYNFEGSFSVDIDWWKTQKGFMKGK